MSVAEGHIAIIGAGLMGGSLGMALRAQGWFVTGTDAEPERADRGLELGAFDAVGADSSAVITFVCTPVSSVVAVARHALAHGGIVTDIGSVKGPVTTALDHPRFIGGHPMAGSELDGIDGSDPLMFQGRTWVLTPTPTSDAASYARLHAVISSLGAVVVSVAPARHDELVAVVSHVPHLVAATLMSVAADCAAEHNTLLRMAAGGFRDMTRIAAGHPGIWLDICTENRSAIVGVLDGVIAELGAMRSIVETADRQRLQQVLGKARTARMNLPVGAPPPEDLVEIRVPIPDRPGFIAEVATLASHLGVNIFDVELSHSIEGDRGTLVVVVATRAADLLRGGLLARGFRPSVSSLGER